MRPIRNTIPLLILILSAMLLNSGCSSMTAAMKASPSLTNAMGIASIPLDELKKKYTDERSQFIEINGLNIHYRVEGDGEPVVLVHGIVSSLQTWDDWATELRKSYKVISLDVPGYGLTGGPENEDDFNEEFLINTFAKFIDVLELDRINLAGNSLGGYISAQYASQYPNRVKKLILLDPVAYPQKTPWVMDFATLPGIKQMGKLVAPPLLVTANVEDTYGDPDRIQEQHMARYVHMSQRPGAKTAYIKTFEMLKARSTQEVPMPFHSITAPTLLMWGGRDAWVPVELSQRWQEDIAHALLKVYPTAGHMPMEEIPEITVKDAMAFLNGDSIETTDYAAFANSKAADHLN